jgi:hypothetical protein
MLAGSQEIMYEVLTDLWEELTKAIYVEDIADVIARKLFPGDRSLTDVEKTIQAQDQVFPARIAMMHVKRRLTNYEYMCNRRARDRASTKE